MTDTSPYIVKLKQHKLLGMILLGGVVSAWGFYELVLSDESVKTVPKPPEARFSSALSHTDAVGVWQNRMEADLAEALKRGEDARKKAEETQSHHETKSTESNQILQSMKDEMSLLQKEMMGLKAENESLIASIQSEKIKEKSAAALSAAAGMTNDNTLPSGEYRPASLGRSQGIREDKLMLSKRKSDTVAPNKNPDTYVPSGTFVEAVILGGADAAASVTSQNNPNPIHLRLIEQGTLPNKKQSHLKDCVATAAVTGDISSERGEVRLETLSCVKKDNSILDVRVWGTVFDGDDGKNAVWGKVVFREGAMVQRAAAAGLFSGFSDALSQTYTTASISPLGSTDTVNNNAIWQYGASKGASTAMDKLSTYYIQRAEQYHPVIQISPGRKVTVVFTKGFYLTEEENNKAAEESSKKEKDSQVVIEETIRVKDETAGLPPSYWGSQPTSIASQAMEGDLESPLTLTAAQVARIKERQKELGLMVKDNENE